MKIDLHRVESKRAAQFKEIDEASSALENVRSKYIIALERRGYLREDLVERIRQTDQRIGETAQAFKRIVRKLDSAKRKKTLAEEELSIINKEQAVIKGKYKELLSGRLPPVDDLPEGTLIENGFDWKKSRQRFLKDVEKHFEDMDIQLEGLEKRRNRLDNDVADLKRKTYAYDEKSKTLDKTLDIYKQESEEFEKELALSLEEEEVLIEQLIDFTERLTAVATVPTSIEKILTRNIQTDTSGEAP